MLWHIETRFNFLFNARLSFKTVVKFSRCHFCGEFLRASGCRYLLASLSTCYSISTLTCHMFFSSNVFPKYYHPDSILMDMRL